MEGVICGCVSVGKASLQLSWLVYPDKQSSFIIFLFKLINITQAKRWYQSPVLSSNIWATHVEKAISSVLSPIIRHLKPDPLSCIRSNLKIDGVSIVSIFQWKIVHRYSKFSFVNDDAYICFAYFCCWPSQLELQNILTASLQRGKTPSPPMSVLDRTLNNLMVGFQ